MIRLAWDSAARGWDGGSETEGLVCDERRLRGGDWFVAG